MIAISSIYGIELLYDNTLKCRQILFEYFRNRYFKNFKEKINDLYLKNIFFIINKNIICGDALSLKTNKNKDICFCE